MTPKYDNYGKKVGDIELLELFPAAEGTITQYYGRIGQGKTYSATADVLDDLANGEVVYTNWRLNWHGFDERSSFRVQIKNWLLFRRRFYKFRKENLRFIDIDEDFLDNFELLTDCKVYLDEGHVAFDSYEMAKMSLRKRKAVLHTRHFNRTICIVSQRPTAVHVSMRANVNIFYKCEKLLSWPFLIFRRTEFQDLTSETVDETQPISKKIYFAKQEVLNAYNSKYLRGGIQKSQEVYFDAYDLNFSERTSLLMQGFKSALADFGRRILLLKQENSTPPPEAATQEIAPNYIPNSGMQRKKKIDFSKLREEREARKSEKEPNLFNQGDAPF